MHISAGLLHKPVIFYVKSHNIYPLTLFQLLSSNVTRSDIAHITLKIYIVIVLLNLQHQGCFLALNLLE